MLGSREAVVFRNRDGHRLFGTLHMPESPDPGRPIIVLLSPGIKMRVGPHGLYNRMTDSFLRQGFTVFKFDFFGLGDSEGELERGMMAEVYLDTQTGMFVNDTADALEWLAKKCGASAFVLGGLCGGAITGMLLAKDDLRVQGLLSLGIPTSLEIGATNHQKTVTQAQLAELRKGYLRRLFQPRSWLRLLTFRSDFRTIFKSIGQLLRKKRPSKRNGANIDKQQHAAPDTNPHFAPAFFGLAASRRKHLLIFSERDRLLWEFEEKFVDLHEEELAKVNNSYEVHVVKNANHIFSFREWENDMQKIANRWLKANFLAQESAPAD